MRLSSFPAELLQLITNELLAHHLGRLICCGDKTLLNRMGSEGGVSLVSVELCSERKAVWPSLVKYFPELVTFKVINCAGYHEMPHSWKPNWKDLPKGLDAIELNYPNDTQEFFTEANLKHLEYLELISCESLMEFEFDVWAFGWLRTNCTLLRVLRLNGDDFFVGYLPETLEEISFASNLATSSVYEMPQMLNKVELISLAIQPDVFASICKLPHLETLCLYSDPLTEDDLMNVPQSLTHLEIFIGYDEIDSATLKLLPPGLRTFHCSGARVNSSNIKLLPRPLLSTDVIHQLAARDVPSLPPAIQHLIDCKVTLEVAAILPTSIRSFEVLEVNSQWDVPNSNFLPSIQYLKCPFLPSATHDGLCSLSSRLQTLEIQGTDCIDDLPNNQCSPLPSGLRSLTIRERHSNIIYKPTGAETIISYDFLCLLPPHLTNLEILGVFFLDDISFAPLPSTLKYLNLVCNSLPFGSPATLPDSIETLLLSVWEPPRRFSTHFLKHLPQGLRKLIYTITNEDDDCEIVNDVVTQLPPHITSVTIPHSSLLDNACTKILPRSVTEFKANRIQYHRLKTMD